MALIGFGFTSPVMSMEERVVIITGATRGIGLSSAQYFSEKGWHVYGTIRPSREAPVAETEHLHFLKVDLSDEPSIQDAVATILQKEGHIDRRTGICLNTFFHSLRIENHFQ